MFFVCFAVESSLHLFCTSWIIFIIFLSCLIYHRLSQTGINNICIKVIYIFADVLLLTRGRGRVIGWKWFSFFPLTSHPSPPRWRRSTGRGEGGGGGRARRESLEHMHYVSYPTVKTTAGAAPRWWHCILMRSCVRCRNIWLKTRVLVKTHRKWSTECWGERRKWFPGSAED